MLSGDGLCLKTIPSRILLLIVGGAVALIALFFVAGFFLAPDAYIHQPDPHNDPENGGYLPHQITSNVTTFTHRVTGLTNLFNGQWWFYLRPTSPPDHKVPPRPFEVLLDITAWTDPAHPRPLHTSPVRLMLKDFLCYEGWCRSQIIASDLYVEEENLDLRVEIPVVSSEGDEDNLACAMEFQSLGTQFVHKSFAFWIFEVGSRYLFLVATILVSVFFMRSLWQVGQRQVTAEQKLVLALLATLILFNNPVCFGDAIVLSWVWRTLDLIFTFTHVCTLLLAILVFSHGILMQEEDYPFLKFYLPKLVLVAAMWGLNVYVFIMAPWSLHTSSVYADYGDYRAHLIVNTVSCAVAGIYFFHILYVVCRTIEKWNRLPMFSIRCRVLWGVMLMMLLFTAAALAVFTYEPNNGAEFLTVFGVYNCFTYCLALFLAPSDKEDVAMFLHSRFGELSGDEQPAEVDDHNYL